MKTGADSGQSGMRSNSKEVSENIAGNQHAEGHVKIENSFIFHYKHLCLHIHHIQISTVKILNYGNDEEYLTKITFLPMEGASD